MPTGTAVVWDSWLADNLSRREPVRDGISLGTPTFVVSFASHLYAIDGSPQVLLQAVAGQVSCG